jgi:hypothetical protein
MPSVASAGSANVNGGIEGGGSAGARVARRVHNVEVARGSRSRSTFCTASVQNVGRGVHRARISTFCTRNVEITARSAIRSTFCGNIAQNVERDRDRRTNSTFWA